MFVGVRGVQVVNASGIMVSNALSRTAELYPNRTT